MPEFGESEEYEEMVSWLLWLEDPSRQTTCAEMPRLPDPEPSQTAMVAVVAQPKSILKKSVTCAMDKKTPQLPVAAAKPKPAPALSLSRAVPMLPKQAPPPPPQTAVPKAAVNVTQPKQLPTPPQPVSTPAPVLQGGHVSAAAPEGEPEPTVESLSSRIHVTGGVLWLYRHVFAELNHLRLKR